MKVDGKKVIKVRSWNARPGDFIRYNYDFYQVVTVNSLIKNQTQSVMRFFYEHNTPSFIRVTTSTVWRFEDEV